MSKGVQNSQTSALYDVLSGHEASVLEAWIREMSGETRRADLMKDSELRTQCSRFLALLRQGVASGTADPESDAWHSVREQLAEVSRTRAQQGVTPTETATFVLSVKKPLFALLRQEAG